MKLRALSNQTSRRGMVEKEIKKFNGGVNRVLEEARIGETEATEATNLMQVEDGIWKVRWGSAYYGATHDANIDGAAEYVNEDGSTELITVADGKAWKSEDGGGLTELSGATFTAGEQCFFMQIAGYLYIANGTDDLVRYNGTSLSTYTEISAPTNLAGTASASLGSGIYNMYAEVTAFNTVGETVGSTEASVTNGMSRPRDQWVSGDNVTWTWTDVASASVEGYNLYISDTTGHETLLTNIAASSYVDDGDLTINPYIEPPLSNTTAGPKFKSMAVSNNRMWGTNDPENPYTAYFSGTGQDMGNFSDFYGGGWINLEKGGRERTKSVVHYQTGQGSGRATVLCSTPEGKGAVWQIGIAEQTVGDWTFPVPSAVKIVGSSGTDSQLSVTADNNNVWFFNRRGIFTLGPEQNYYGLLRTNEISARIRNYIRGLIGSQIDNVCAYFYDAKVFFSVPTVSTYQRSQRVTIESYIMIQKDAIGTLTGL